MHKEMPPIVWKLYRRWQKRVFANDNIVCQPSKEGEGYWELAITRGNKRAFLIVSPQTAYRNYRFMLDADEYMRSVLGDICVSEKK